MKGEEKGGAGGGQEGKRRGEWWTYAGGGVDGDKHDPDRQQVSHGQLQPRDYNVLARVGGLRSTRREGGWDGAGMGLGWGWVGEG